MTIGKTSSLFLTLLAGILFGSGLAFASGSMLPSDEKKPLEPATTYSGSAPIDMKNGIPFNNGTFGARNPNYEKWAEAPILFPGIDDLPYPYKWKSSFVKGLQENIHFVEAAIEGWKSTSAIKKPEAKEYGEKAAAMMEPQLAKLKEAVRLAASASETDWEKAQASARSALIETRATYTSLHRNTH